jgi:hypothetical protein
LSSLYRIMIKTRGIIVWFHHTWICGQYR